jgi:hypothetical protein
LACELAARFYLEIGDLPSALDHFLLSHEKYELWGAVGKAALLFAFVNDKFSGMDRGNDQETVK